MSDSDQTCRLVRSLRETAWRPCAGAFAIHPVGWLLDALPGIRIGRIEYIGFIAAAAFAIRYALTRR